MDITQLVWIVEHREAKITSDGHTIFDTVIVYVASTYDKAETWLKTVARDKEETGWFVIYSEVVDGDFIDLNSKLKVFDVSGNELAEQPL